VQCIENVMRRVVSWRRRPAGGFSYLNGAENRRQDAGATETLHFSNDREEYNLPSGFNVGNAARKILSNLKQIGP
jgi:hypothetical protein